MKVSDWIHTCHNMNKITGFITEINGNEVIVFVTIPQGYGSITLKLADIWPADETIWMDDIPTMIDLSLKTRDKEWFQKWMKEMSLWKSVEEVDRMF